MPVWHGFGLELRDTLPHACVCKHVMLHVDRALPRCTGMGLENPIRPVLLHRTHGRLPAAGHARAARFPGGTLSAGGRAVPLA